MTQAYIAKLGLAPRITNVDVQKIDSLALKTYGMTIVGFSVVNKPRQIRFFKKTFLLVDTSIKVILGMLFLSLSNANIHFDTNKLI